MRTELRPAPWWFRPPVRLKNGAARRSTRVEASNNRGARRSHSPCRRKTESATLPEVLESRGVREAPGPQTTAWCVDETGSRRTKKPRGMAAPNPHRFQPADRCHLGAGARRRRRPLRPTANPDAPWQGRRRASDLCLRRCRARAAGPAAADQRHPPERAVPRRRDPRGDRGRGLAQQGRDRPGPEGRRESRSPPWCAARRPVLLAHPPQVSPPAPPSRCANRRGKKEGGDHGAIGRPSSAARPLARVARLDS